MLSAAAKTKVSDSNRDRNAAKSSIPILPSLDARPRKDRPISVDLSVASSAAVCPSAIDDQNGLSNPRLPRARISPSSTGTLRKNYGTLLGVSALGKTAVGRAPGSIDHHRARDQ